MSREADAASAELAALRQRVTELERERQALATQRLESLMRLAGGMAHALNNLLTGIVGHISLALHSLPLDLPVHHSLEQIKEAVARAEDLTRQLQVYAGRVNYVTRPTTLGELALELQSRLRQGLGQGVTLETRCEDKPIVVEIAPGPFEQAVVQLVTNAAQAIGCGPGTITLALGCLTPERERPRQLRIGEPLPGTRYAFLEVADTGHGIDARTVARMFDPFFAERSGGRGLGLAAVLGIVRSHGGFIEVESAPGAGTLVRVLLPIVAPRVGLSEQEGAADGHGALVVDDDETVLSVAQRMLERLGFRVVLARNGQQALDLLRKEGRALDLALVDVALPQLDGRQLHRELNQIRPDLPVILSSGYSLREIVPAELACSELTAFIQKPYRFSQLKEIVEQMVRRGL